jgi:hypothetical protein
MPAAKNNVRCHQAHAVLAEWETVALNAVCEAGPINKLSLRFNEFAIRRDHITREREDAQPHKPCPDLFVMQGKPQ